MGVLSVNIVGRLRGGVVAKIGVDGVFSAAPQLLAQGWVAKEMGQVFGQSLR